SLQTYFGSLNRAVCLANGVDGSIQRRQIRGKDNETTDRQTTGQDVARSYPNDTGGPVCDYNTNRSRTQGLQDVKVNVCLEAFLTFGHKPTMFLFALRESLNHADSWNSRLHDGNNTALLLVHVGGGSNEPATQRRDSNEAR